LLIIVQDVVTLETASRRSSAELASAIPGARKDVPPGPQTWARLHGNLWLGRRLGFTNRIHRPNTSRSAVTSSLLVKLFSPVGCPALCVPHSNRSLENDPSVLRLVSIRTRAGVEASPCGHAAELSVTQRLDLDVDGGVSVTRRLRDGWHGSEERV
jgi:hypothetical protein